jgi:hypothetical protein
MATATPWSMRILSFLELELVSGGRARRQRVPTVLVDGRPTTCAQLMRAGDELFAHGDDKSIPNEVWLGRYWKLDHAFQQLPSLASCPKAK